MTRVFSHLLSYFHQLWCCTLVHTHTCKTSAVQFVSCCDSKCLAHCFHMCLNCNMHLWAGVLHTGINVKTSHLYHMNSGSVADRITSSCKCSLTASCACMLASNVSMCCTCVPFFVTVCDKWNANVKSWTWMHQFRGAFPGISNNRMWTCGKLRPYFKCMILRYAKFIVFLFTFYVYWQQIRYQQIISVML